MFEEGNKANVSLNKDGIIQFELCKNAYIFIFTGKKIPSAPNKCKSATSKDCYTSISNNKRNKYHLLTYPMILFCLNINDAAGMNHSCKIFERSCRYGSLSTF